MNDIDQGLNKRDIHIVDQDTSLSTECFYIRLKTIHPNMFPKNTTGEGVKSIEGQRFVRVRVLNSPEHVLLEIS